MSMEIASNSYPSFLDTARKELKEIESKITSKAETLEDLRDTTGKVFKTADLEKLMEKYDPDAYAQYSKIARSAEGALTQSGASFLSKWMDNVKKGLNDGTLSSDGTKAAAKTSTGTRSTAADELAYLSKKYSGYSFVSANYTKGMQYGSTSTVNVAISPQFLAKMANDPELEAEYEGYLSDMQKLDEQEDAMRAGSGWSTVARGWVIDKDGGISKWGISKKDDGKTFLQKMSENAEKIRKQNGEKKKEKAELAEKRELSKEEQAELKEKLEEIGKEKLGEKFKGVIILGSEENTPVSQKADKELAAGANLDLKA